MVLNTTVELQAVARAITHSNDEPYQGERTSKAYDALTAPGARGGAGGGAGRGLKGIIADMSSPASFKVALSVRCAF